MSAVGSALAGALLVPALRTVSANPPVLPFRTRNFGDSDVFGGTILGLLFGHQSDPRVMGRTADLGPYLGGEMHAVGLIPGALAMVALVLGAGLLFGGRGWPLGADRLLALFAGLALCVFVWFTRGGLGMTASLFYRELVGGVVPLRVWSRLALVLAFLGLACGAVIFEAFWRSPRRWVRAGAVLGLAGALGVAWVDQVRWDRVGPDYWSQNAAVADDIRVSLAAMKGEVADGCRVLQVPVDTFPIPVLTSTSDLRSVYSTDLLPPLLAQRWGWSYGAWAGTPNADWQRVLPPALGLADLRALRAAGFCVLWRDTVKSGPEYRRAAALTGEAARETRDLEPAGDRYLPELIEASAAPPAALACELDAARTVLPYGRAGLAAGVPEGNSERFAVTSNRVFLEFVNRGRSCALPVRLEVSGLPDGTRLSLLSGRQALLTVSSAGGRAVLDGQVDLATDPLRLTLRIDAEPATLAGVTMVSRIEPAPGRVIGTLVTRP